MPLKEVMQQLSRNFRRKKKLGIQVKLISHFLSSKSPWKLLFDPNESDNFLKKPPATIMKDGYCTSRLLFSADECAPPPTPPDGKPLFGGEAKISWQHGGDDSELEQQVELF